MAKNKSKSMQAFSKDIAESWRKERPDLDTKYMILSIYVSRIGRIAETAYNRMCEQDFGIRGTDMRVLYALRRSGAPFALRPTDLYKTTLVTSGAISKQVDRLEALGYVQRLPDPRNGVGSLVQLTSDGYELVNKAVAQQADTTPLIAATEDMTDEDVDAGLHFCEKVLQSLEHNLDL